MGGGGRPIRKGVRASSHPSNEDIDHARSPLLIHQARKVIARKQEQLLLEPGAAFLSQVRTELSDSILALLPPTTEETTFFLICYGIGRIFQAQVAQWQLAVLLSIKEWLPSVLPSSCILKAQVFDPVLGEGESTLLQECGFQVLSADEQCKRVVGAGERAFFYMPHGEGFMYANLVEANKVGGLGRQIGRAHV